MGSRVVWPAGALHVRPRNADTVSMHTFHPRIHGTTRLLQGNPRAPRLVMAMLLVMFTVVVLAACGDGSPAEQKPAAAPRGYLWVQTASGGSLTGNDSEHLTLVLSGVPDYITRFTDRPARESEVVAPEDTAARWRDFFAASAPNATLTFVNQGASAPQTVSLVLGQPIYDAAARTMTYPAQRIPETRDTLAGASRAVSAPPVANPASFGPASLFIDDGRPRMVQVGAHMVPTSMGSVPIPILQMQSDQVGRCTLQPFTSCSGASLYGDMSGAPLSGADLSWANVSGNLSDSDLSGANLTSAFLLGVNFSGANLTSTRMAGANLSFANLSGADLTGATLTGAKMTGAKMAGAICPSGKKITTALKVCG